MPDPGYYALAYLCTTGQVVQQVPLVAEPTWTQQIDSDGPWTVQTPVGGAGGLPKATLRGLLQPGRVGIATCWGTGSGADYICQAGPIWSWSMTGTSESSAVVQIGGTGFWGLLKALVQFASGWNGVSLGSGADTTWTSSLQGIAANLLTNASNRWQALISVPMPIDIPAAISGAVTMSYYGYQFGSVGTRLQELTQQAGGPDVLFAPYFDQAHPGYIRHAAQLGNPYLAQPGLPLIFDYPGQLESILPAADGSRLATTSYTVGNGTQYGTLWAQASDTTLLGSGWPPLEYPDISHSNEQLQTALNSYATSTQALYGRPLETWVVTARTDPALSSPFGSFTPGVSATYNVTDHPLILDGSYSQRIIGLANGQAIGEVKHLLQATQGQV